MTARPVTPFLALAGVVAVTLAWWAFALGPLPATAPEWLDRARAVCFGIDRAGLPDVAGWIALVVQPLVMLAVVQFGWGAELTGGVRDVLRGGIGRVIVGSGLVALVVGIALVGRRVEAAAWSASSTRLPAGSKARLDLPAPPLRLVDQRGRRVQLESFRGRAVLVTFAFGHCRTVCPLVVDAALAAQRASIPRPVVVVVTLDPWRDTPSRLPRLARRWKLGEDAFLLSGPIRDVEAALDEWGVPRSRDGRTGDVVHPSRVVVVDPEGRIAYVAGGEPHRLVDLLARL